MRTPSAAWSWLKRTSFLRTLVNSFTGTFTSPKLIDPLQIALATSSPRSPAQLPRFSQIRRAYPSRRSLRSARRQLIEHGPGRPATLADARRYADPSVRGPGDGQARLAGEGGLDAGHPLQVADL